MIERETEFGLLILAEGTSEGLAREMIEMEVAVKEAIFTEREI